MIVVTALVLKAVADVILAYADQAREIGQVTSRDFADGRGD